MILVTTESVVGRKTVETLGMVEGACIVSPGIGAGISAAFSALNPGRVKELEQVFEQGRALARKEMVEKATALGAGAVVAIRYASSEIGQGLCEVTAYGTAVKLAE